MKSPYHLSKVALERAVLGQDVRKQRLIREFRQRDLKARAMVFTVLVIRNDHGIAREVLFHT